MEITGPAAGHALMKTAADPAGRRVKGMLNNCAGGVTPWGTWVTCEENINGYFWGKLADEPSAKPRSYKRYGVPVGRYNWGTWHDRFDVDKEPNEPNRFGWVVEIDPFDPDFRSEEAHGARPLQARGRRAASSTRTDATSSIQATTSASTTSTSSSPRHGQPERPGGQYGPPRPRARSTWPDTTPTAPASGCRSCMDTGRSPRPTGSRTRARF